MISDTLAIYMNVFFVLYPLGPYESIRQYPFVREEKKEKEKEKENVYLLEKEKRGYLPNNFKRSFISICSLPPLFPSHFLSVRHTCFACAFDPFTVSSNHMPVYSFQIFNINPFLAETSLKGRLTPHSIYLE